MLNSMLVSIWAILVTLGIFYLGQNYSGDADSKNPPAVTFETFRTKNVSTALFREGNFSGHFVTIVKYELPENVQKNLQIPLEFLVGDRLFSILGTMDIKDAKILKKENLKKIAQQLEETLWASELPIKNIQFENAELLAK